MVVVLPEPFGPKQAEDLALLDFEVERLESPDLGPTPEVAIDLREGPRFDDSLIRHTIVVSRRQMQVPRCSLRQGLRAGSRGRPKLWIKAI